MRLPNISQVLNAHYIGLMDSNKKHCNTTLFQVIGWVFMNILDEELLEKIQVLCMHKAMW